MSSILTGIIVVTIPVSLQNSTMEDSGNSILLIGGVLGMLIIGGAVVGPGFGGIGESPAGDGSESPGEQTELEITDVSGPAELRPDDQLQVRARVENPGETAITQRVTLQLNSGSDDQLSETVTTETVELASGESTNVILTANSEQISPGKHTYGVSVGESDPQAHGDVTVLHPPTFLLSDETTDTDVVRGTNATFDVNLTNNGDYRGLGTVRLSVDRDQNGQFADTETLDDRVLSLGGGQSELAEFELQTTELEPGQYQYRVVSENQSTTGTLTVQQPATFRVLNTTVPHNVTRGEDMNVSAVVENTGDVEGITNVTISDGSNTTIDSQSVTLAGNDSTTLSFRVNTTNRSRGTHTYSVATDSNAEPVPVTVQDSHFEISDLRGPDVLYIGDTAVFSATVTNTGKVSGTQTVDHKIDSDGDDRPEAYGVNRMVTLEPGESKRVTFEVEYTVTDTTDYPVEPLGLQTYVYGIYSADTRASNALSVKPSWARDDDGSSRSDSVSDGEPASLDEITQDKYGLYFEEVSGETKQQIREIHERQPFADGLAAAEVRTREEIARQEYGADVERGDNFDFTGLDIAVQQDVEADFDSQFQTESGDRIESWDELAQAEHGTDYENLTDSQQEDIREEYQEQFE